MVFLRFFDDVSVWVLPVETCLQFVLSVSSCTDILLLLGHSLDTLLLNDGPSVEIRSSLFKTESSHNVKMNRTTKSNLLLGERERMEISVKKMK
jgi:hypothetical protein